jgi:hypothetical protein
LDTVILDYADHTNNHPEANETFTFGKTETRFASKKFSTTNTHTVGFKEAIKVSGTLLGIGGESTTELSYQFSTASTEEMSTDMGVQLTYMVATTLRPGQRVFCRATAMGGQYKGDYTAKTNIWLKDGSTWSYRTTGTFEQVQWSKASSICQDMDFPPVTDMKKRGTKFIA